ncbi:MAG: hypothetical protein K8S99_10990 [Planctomycetes bacterium]|nr:hypothetical protein [Planctomycetota bacterium]
MERSIGRARARIYLQDVLNDLGLSLVIALIAGMLLLTIDRLLSLGLGWWVYALFAVTALATAPCTAWVRRPNDAATATLIDQRLNLKDRLATALYARRMADDPFAKQVIDEAQSIAGSLDLASAFRARWSRAWAWLPPLAAVAALLAVFLAPMDLLGREQKRADQQQQEAEAKAAQEQVVQAVAAVRSLKDQQRDPTDLETEEAMHELAALTQRELTNPDMRRDAAAKLSRVQDKLAQEAQQQESRFNTMQSMLSRLDAGEPGPADKFTDALRRGDLAAAQQASEEMASNLDKMSPEDRAALERQLDNLAEQLQQAAKQAEQQQQQAQQQTEQTLQNAGLSKEQVQQLAKQNFNQQAVQQALQQNGMNQQQAQQTAQQLQQQQQQKQNSGQCQNSAKGLSSSLKQMSQCAGGQSGSSGKSSQQGQQSQQNQNFSQSAQNANSQLNQMSQMQNAMQQLRLSQSQLAQASSKLSGQPNPGQGRRQGSPGGNGAGRGGDKAGHGSGGDPLGLHQNQPSTPYQTEAKGDIGEGDGKIIASWMENGEMSKGESKLTFDKAVTEAKHDAEQAVTEDRVPRRYHEAIKEYFNQMPQTPDKVAPKAPR